MKSKQTFKCHILALILLAYSSLYAQQKQFSIADLNKNGTSDLESKFSVVEVPVFKKDSATLNVILENGYSQSAIQNKNDWPKKEAKYMVTAINLIYTKYPKKKELWLTNYRSLMVERLNELFKLDSTLNSNDIEWSIVLQISCETESDAKKMLHGFEIVYELNESLEIKDTATIKTTETKSIVPARDTKTVTTLLRNLKPTKDSTVSNVLNRHPEWQNSLVVMDWSSSMQQYAAKVILWHVQHVSTSGIKYLTVFTDGEKGKVGTLGNYGGVYFSYAYDLKNTLALLKKATRRSLNIDTEENNLEAIVKGIDHFPDADEVILIADNRSCMKDYCLLHNIKVPIRIVLCGTEGGINPQYVNLAYKTGGSIHTIDSDIKG